MNVPSVIRDKRFKLAVLALGAAFCATMIWNYPYFAFERSVRHAAGGHLDDLSIISDYLSPPLVKGDFAKFGERAVVVSEVMKRNDVSNGADEYVGLLERTAMEKACGSAEAEGMTGLRTLCEWKRLSDSGKSPVECGSFTDSEARAECRRSNDTKFSVESNSHCSKADCLVNNAVFKSAAKGIPSCGELPQPLILNCQTILESYEKFVRDPESFEKPEIENALLGRTNDETWLAARKAVLENPDSPSDECRSFTGSQLEVCEAKTKALFSYVQLRGLKNRLNAISEAVKELKKNYGTP